MRYADRDGDGVVGASGPTDHDDGVTEYTYTDAGRLSAVIEPPESVSSFNWATGSGKRTTSYGYDQAGRRTSVVDALSQTTTTTYTGRGEVERVTKPGGYYVEYGYDPAGRVTSVTVPSPTGTGTATVVSTYDARGLLTAQSEQHQSGTSSPPATTYSYYDDGSMATVTNPLGGANNTVGYFWDGRGNRVARTSVTQASSGASTHTVTDVWAYDLVNRVTSEQAAGAAGPTTRTYDELTGRAATTTMPSGRVNTYTWTNSGLLASTTSTKPADTYGPAETWRGCYWVRHGRQPHPRPR
ncbi:MAG: hypothetical protein V9E94_04815 [Microthrixaceae bacterium]